jgi:prepilin-type N-terminal cleavage/methylation domain-containing protein
LSGRLPHAGVRRFEIKIGNKMSDKFFFYRGWHGTAEKSATGCRQWAKQNAFTLIELLVVIAIIAILAAILMPVLAAAKGRALQAQCINNTKELQIGWELYATDNQDYMLPNSPYSYAPYQSWCPNGSEAGALMDWSTGKGNTNAVVFTNTILAPYMSGQLGVYRCPADTFASKNGLRVRDYSMQSQVGNLYCATTTSVGNNPNGIAYVKLTDLHSSPGPSDVIVFLEEHPNSLLNNFPDGYLEVHSTDWTFPDVPGSLHKWACGMSFADGHSEMHNWVTPVLRIPVNPSGATISSASTPLTAAKGNPDWYWFTTHCSGVAPGKSIQ